MSRYLPRHGWDVTVVTAKASARVLKRPGARGGDPGVGRGRADRLHRAPERFDRAQQGRARRDQSGGRAVVSHPRRSTGWCRLRRVGALRLHAARRFDAVVATAGPYSALLVGRNVKRSAGIPFVADLRDEWTTNPYLTGRYPSSWHVRYNRALEAGVLLEARPVALGLAPLARRDPRARPRPAGGEVPASTRTATTPLTSKAPPEARLQVPRPVRRNVLRPPSADGLPRGGPPRRRQEPDSTRRLRDPLHRSWQRAGRPADYRARCSVSPPSARFTKRCAKCPRLRPCCSSFPRRVAPATTPARSSITSPPPGRSCAWLPRGTSRPSSCVNRGAVSSPRPTIRPRSRRHWSRSGAIGRTAVCSRAAAGGGRALRGRRPSAALRRHVGRAGVRARFAAIENVSSSADIGRRGGGSRGTTAASTRRASWSGSCGATRGSARWDSAPGQPRWGAFRRALSVPPAQLVARLRADDGARAACFSRRSPRGPRGSSFGTTARRARFSTSVEPLLSRTFDLLGSGPVRPLRPDGGIDWHRDPVSGLGWDPSTHHVDLVAVRGDGSDVKWPWELSRCQHLPVLGLASRCASLLLAPAAASALRARCAVEAAAEIDDWIERNPRGLGVNWSCTMDVAIRAFNWCPPSRCSATPRSGTIRSFCASSARCGIARTSHPQPPGNRRRRSDVESLPGERHRSLRPRLCASRAPRGGGVAAAPRGARWRRKWKTGAAGWRRLSNGRSRTTVSRPRSSFTARCSRRAAARRSPRPS